MKEGLQTDTGEIFLPVARNLYATLTPGLLGQGILDIYYGAFFYMHDMF